MGGCESKRQAKRKFYGKGEDDDNDILADYEVWDRDIDEKETGKPVFLNVYDLLLMNYTTSKMGIGIYHTGVQVHGLEYCYSGHNQCEMTGLRITTPRDSAWIEDAIFSRSIFMGYTDKTQAEINEIYDKMHSEFPGPSYNVLTKNCNHFTESFIRRILKEDIVNGRGDSQLPPFVTRVVRTARKCRPCMPAMLTDDLRDQNRVDGGPERL